jgi:hypothetical protein
MLGTGGLSSKDRLEFRGGDGFHHFGSPQWSETVGERWGEGEELVDEDGLVLADAVCAVGRLVFGGGVPPRVVKTFKMGKILLPILHCEYKYEVNELESGKWLGRITNPPGTDGEVIVIDMGIASDYRERTGSSLFPVKTTRDKQIHLSSVADKSFDNVCKSRPA